MSSIAANNAKPINPFAATKRKPLNLAQQLGIAGEAPIAPPAVTGDIARTPMPTPAPIVRKQLPINANTVDALAAKVTSPATAALVSPEPEAPKATAVPARIASPAPRALTPSELFDLGTIARGNDEPPSEPTQPQAAHVGAPPHISAANTAAQARTFTANAFQADLEAANALPAPAQPSQFAHHAGAQGAFMGAYQQSTPRAYGLSTGSKWNPKTWSKKQKIWAGVATAVVAIIIIAASAGSASSHHSSSSHEHYDPIGSAGCDSSNPDSICYGDG